MTYASLFVRSSQNFSQKVDLFLMRSTLVLSVRGSVPPLLLADTPVDILCSDAELLAMNDELPLPTPIRSDCEPERCIVSYSDKRATLPNHTPMAFHAPFIVSTSLSQLDFLISRHAIMRFLFTFEPNEIPS